MPTHDELAAEVGRLARRVDECEALLAIQRLKARYGELVDLRYRDGTVAGDPTLARAAEGAASLFTHDAVWDGGPGLGGVTGRDAIADRLRRPTLSFARHLFANPRIEVDGDRARGRWDLLSPCRRPDGRSFWMYGFEDDEYRRVDGEWLIASLTLTTVFLTPVGEGWDPIPG